MNRIIAVLIFVLLSSCQKKENDLGFEKRVMNEIFLEVVDSIYTDLNFIPPPPPPYPDVFFKTTSKKIKDSIIESISKNYEKRIIEFNELLDKRKKENKKTTIAIQDSIQGLSKNYKFELIKEYGNLEFNIDSIEINTDYRIELTKFNKTDKYNFRYISEFPKENNIWRWRFENNYDLKAIISFSRILFDKSRNYGVLKGEISYGDIDGNGFLIFIKKESDKWIIDKIIETWIS